MHRDIRWPNVLRIGTSDIWFLVDLDDALQFPAIAITGAHLHMKYHAPEIFSQDTHDYAVDLWSIGHLMSASKRFIDSTELEELKQRLLSEDPKARPQIDECIKIIKDQADKLPVTLPTSQQYLEKVK